MTVRLRLALTIFATGIVTALGVLVTVAIAFQRFEHESTYERANAFIGRVVALHPDLLDLQARDADGFTGFLRNLLLFEPNSQLYLLDAQGNVLAASGSMQPKPGFKVRLEPVREAVAVAGDRRRAPYVMGDDPEHMNLDAVIAARPLRRAVIRRDGETAGYLYLVCQPPSLNVGHAEVYRSTLAGTAMTGVMALIVGMTLCAAWIVATVTRPLRDLSDTVARAQREGFEGSTAVDTAAVGAASGDEFARLRAGFHALLTRLRAQWDALRELDQFRRESVSNLSHDLRSPLTATAACLETLDRRWVDDASRGDDRELLEVALRNTRNAAQLVRSLGDLALLDEPQFRLQPLTMDLAEMLDDIVMRFGDRAAQQGVALRNDSAPGSPAFAAVDIELFERAVANLVDNALKHTSAGGRVTLQAQRAGDQVCVRVCDSGRGIAAHDLEHLFDRLYTGAGARGDADGGGKGLGLAIVKRIVELHRGEVAVRSAPGEGTEVTIRLPGASE
jgi:signal transduction histidine kinase